MESSTKDAAFINLLLLHRTCGLGILVLSFQMGKWAQRWVSFPRIRSMGLWSLCHLPGGILCPGWWPAEGCKRQSSRNSEVGQVARTLGREVWAARGTCWPRSLWRTCPALRSGKEHTLKAKWGRWRGTHTLISIQTPSHITQTHADLDQHMRLYTYTQQCSSPRCVCLHPCSHL